VEDAVGDEDVLLGYLGRVDKHAVTEDEDFELAAGGGGVFGVVFKVGGVDDLVGEDVVGEDLLKLFDGHGGDGGAEGLEGVVFRDEHCKAFGFGEVFYFLGCEESSLYSCEVVLCGC